MNAEQYAEELPALHYNGLIGDTDIQAICEMLRRLAAVESDCAPYLKEGETPAERIKRALGDSDSLMSLYRDVVAERDQLRAARIAYASEFPPIPDGDDAGLPAVDRIHENIRRLKAERDALKAENERLTNCLKKANDQAEDFERRWYLADMELERIKALVPVEPTQEMCNPNGEINEVTTLAAGYRAEIWAAMLSAAPAAPQPAQQPLTDEQEKAGRWEWIEANCLSVIDLAGNRICASATAIDLVRRKP